MIPEIFSVNGITLRIGDKIQYENASDNCFVGTICFGRFSQDGSGGEYYPRPVMGYYIKREYCVLQEWQDEEDLSWIENDYEGTVSVLDVKNIEVIESPKPKYVIKEESHYGYNFYCPICMQKLENFQSGIREKYCPECGLKLELKGDK